MRPLQLNKGLYGKEGVLNDSEESIEICHYLEEILLPATAHFVQCACLTTSCPLTVIFYLQEQDHFEDGYMARS